ncbi:unnamed protein product [Candida verbasci]|uniref:Myb/SANT-like domain-containing protein n=1 Tax=Candida verbasci TaxID=1227364 RepID=A0A9W4TRX5_9ASCO|nr:unnamed protein product [Candida verbasci]
MSNNNNNNNNSNSSTHSLITNSNHLILQESNRKQFQLQLHPLHQSQSPPAVDLTKYDLKSKESKYKRWTPRMDQYLIKLLSDVVHSFPQGSDIHMSKKSWNFVCNQLRNVNPETVYSTYTKYSCQQHLINVIQYRYKIWYKLMKHSKFINSSKLQDLEYSYKWNPKIGRFQIIDLSTNLLIIDERLIKTILYSESLNLPPLKKNKSQLIINDFFLSDNLKYMSVYHNEILPLLIKMDTRYLEDIGDEIYSEIPKFSYPEANKEYGIKNIITKKRKRKEMSDLEEFNKLLNNGVILTENENENEDEEEELDPMLKNGNNNNVLAEASLAAINSPNVIKNGIPIYIKDKAWFNKLISLYNLNLLNSNEVLIICQGVRDNKIPLFMLNILDHDYYLGSNKANNDDLSNEEIMKRIKEFMLPMVYNQ